MNQNFCLFESKLQSLSNRLNHITTTDVNLNWNFHIQLQSIKFDNTKWNISSLIAEIILNLTFSYQHQTKKNFEEIIDAYNNANSTKLDFHNFEKVYYVREIIDTIVIPEKVKSFINTINRNSQSNMPSGESIPEDKKDLINCLQIYDEKYPYNPPLIHLEKLEEIINKFGRVNLNTDYLVENSILEISPDVSDTYNWLPHNLYINRDLGGEIAAKIWLNIPCNFQDDEQRFKHFIQILYNAGIHPHNLFEFLSMGEFYSISQLAIKTLDLEQDLFKAEHEYGDFTKIWLDFDSRDRRHYTQLFTEPSTIKFNLNNSFDFINNVKNYATIYHSYFGRNANNIFYYSGVRSIYDIMLRIIIQQDNINNKYKHHVHNQNPYENTINIFKDMSRPFLSWQLYRNIVEQFPQVISYLLPDFELAPLVFDMLDEININRAILAEQPCSNKQIYAGYELKGQLWREMFEFILEQVANNINMFVPEHSICLTRILIKLSEQVFTDSQFHGLYRKMYYDALNKLSIQRISLGYPQQLLLKPRLVFNLLPYMISYLIEYKKALHASRTPQFIKISTWFMDLSIQIIKLASSCNINIRVRTVEQSQEIEKSIQLLVRLLFDIQLDFYTTTKIEYSSYYSNELIVQETTRCVGNTEFCCEIIDWGYIYLQFTKESLFDDLKTKFENLLIFNTTTNATIYDQQNLEQFKKIYLYLKTCMLAFISINQNSNIYETLQPSDTLDKLEQIIFDYSSKYCHDDILNNKIDVFQEPLNIFEMHIYYKSLISLLAQCINYLNLDKQRTFVINFFDESNDIGRMLTILNLLDAEQTKIYISNKISEINIDDAYMQTVRTDQQLKNTLISAINSTKHWELTEPLLEKFNNYFLISKNRTITDKNLKFEIELVFALKKNDLESLIKIPSPESIQQFPKDLTTDCLRQFYIAVLKLHNNKFNDAINMFQLLLSNQPNNIKYAAYLYYAQTLGAENSRSKEGYLQALLTWNHFKENNYQSSFDDNLSELVIKSDLYHDINNNNHTKLIQIIGELSNKIRYATDVIPPVYKFYCDKKFYTLAYEYISGAKEYFQICNEPVSSNIQEIFDSYENENVLKELKNSWGKVLSEVQPSNIPIAVPNKINPENKLNTFILYELLDTLQIMLKKIISVQSIKNENRYTDVLVAILSKRLAIYGWSAPDQSRAGKSSTGIDAGEVDILIENSNNTTITIIEAFRLNSCDSNIIGNHILKLFTYDRCSNVYYVIIYFEGKNMNTTWDKYKKYVLKIDFPDEKTINKLGFEDINIDFTDKNALKFSKTSHGSNTEIFHIMVDFSNKK